MGKSKTSFTGVFSLLLTPFHKDGKIDWNVYKKYVDWQLTFNPNGLFAVCGTSEMKWLALEERLQLAKIAVQRAGTTPVIATANLDVNKFFHKEEIKRMTETGVSGVVIVPPPKLGRNQSELGSYIMELAKIAKVPVYIYEWPLTDPYFISSELWECLSRDHNIKGIKDTTCTLQDIKEKIAKSSSDMTVFQANAPFMLDSIIAGAKGIMSVTSASFNELVINFWQEVNQDPFSNRVKALHQQIVYLDSILRYGYPATAKYLAKLQGINMNLYCRWPVTLSQEAKKGIELFYEYYKEKLIV